jgi:aspartate kinase
LQAEHVEFYKDVPGVFDQNPHTHAEAKPYPTLDYEQALQVVERCGQILHPRCLRLARSNAIPLLVRSFADPDGKVHPGTLISAAMHTRPNQALFEKSIKG